MMCRGCGDKMKNIRWLFCIALLFVLLVGCSNSQMHNNTDAAVLIDTEYALDVEYKEAINACKSNVEISNTNNSFAQKWKDLGDYYYGCIMEGEYFNDKDEIKDIASSIHNEWIQYAQHRIEDEEKRLTVLYGAGSIVPIKLSQYECAFYRAHSIEMYEICIQLHLDCDQP